MSDTSSISSLPHVQAMGSSAFPSNLEAAQCWFGLGFKVIPLLPGEKRTAVGWSFIDDLSQEKVFDHWSAHPDHEVGFIVGDGVLVLDADTPEALEALERLEKQFGVTPTMRVKTARGWHHYYRRPDDVFARQDSHSTVEHPERLDVKTGRTLVNLPPSGGRALITPSLSSIAELTPVTQEFVDAFCKHNGRPAPRPREQMPPPVDDELPALSTSLPQLGALLAQIDPDLGYDDWVRVMMAVHHETGGSPGGLALVDAWSSRGRSYKGRREVETHWESFRPVNPPVTGATLRAMVRDAGHDWREVEAAAGPDFEPCGETEVLASVVPGSDPVSEEASPRRPTLLDQFSLLGKSEEVAKTAAEQRLLFGSISVYGQLGVIYAAPGTGKTLIFLHLLITAVEQGAVDPSQVYYINVDDDSNGLLTKVRLAEEHGFHMLADGYEGFSSDAFLDLMAEMVAEDQASGVVIILDTVKKFVDLMDKGRSRAFMKIARRFVAKGGSLICLAHTNKNLGSDGKPVYAGVSDFRDDADYAYTIRPVEVKTGDKEKTVLFENIKSRGLAVKEVAFAYAIGNNLSYYETLASVREVDEKQVTELKVAEAIRSDAELIEVVSECIREGINTKMKLASEVGRRAAVSKRIAIQIVERYTGDDPGKHRWCFVVGARGAKVFEVLE